MILLYIYLYTPTPVIIIHIQTKNSTQIALKARTDFYGTLTWQHTEQNWTQHTLMLENSEFKDH